MLRTPRIPSKLTRLLHVITLARESISVVAILTKPLARQELQLFSQLTRRQKAANIVRRFLGRRFSGRVLWCSADRRSLCTLL